MEKNLVLATMESRRSYRGAYLDTPVAEEDLRAILEAGLAAPSGCNKQTVSLIAVDDPEILARLRAVIDPPLGETAPAMVCVVTTPVAAYRDRYFHVQDYAAAIENMLLAIESLGYASCWVEGHITDEDHIGRKMGEILGVPQGSELVCYLPVGRPAGQGRLPGNGPSRSGPGATAMDKLFKEDLMELRVCRAEPSDLPAVKEMYAALVARMDREGWSVWDETYPRDFVGKDIEQGQLYLLLEGDRLAGAFALPAHDNGEGDVPWEDPSAPARYLYRFGVAVEYGGRGLGRLALERIGELARGMGAGYLRLYVAHENLPAMGLYQKAGFTQLPGEFGEFLLDGTRLFEYAFEKRL